MKRLLLILSFFLFLGISLKGQAIFDLQLKLLALDSINNFIHFELLLQNKKDETCGLAGQNYRLFYNSASLSFDSGASLLGDDYQRFTLIQDIQNTNASGVNGFLAFEEHLGFLNFSIDLVNIMDGGVFLSKEKEWVSIAQLSFQLKKKSAINDCLELIWGRENYTDAYATSFVEISEWVSPNNTRAAKIDTFQDWMSDNCKPSTAKNYYLKPKIFLQGCYNQASGLMRDDLRIKRLVPRQDPYSERKITTALKMETAFIETETILDRTGEKAIVDWVLVELRAKETPHQPLITQAALLQRNGNIVATNGIDPLHFYLPQNEYHVVVRHRNHLGVMTAFPTEFSSDAMIPSTIDFTNSSTATYGSNAQVKQAGFNLLWAGDTSGDGYIIFQGGGVGLPDNDAIFFDIVSDKTNYNARYNHVTNGYYNTDTNMDGQIIYQGGNNDIDDLIFFNIFSHPENVNFFTNFFIDEQIQAE